MIGPYELLTLAASVLAGAALPFVPTGEIVSGTSALASGSAQNVLLIFVISWVCSVLGDTILLLEVRRFGRPLQAWLSRHKVGIG